jgi:hypothetical protein
MKGKIEASANIVVVVIAVVVGSVFLKDRWSTTGLPLRTTRARQSWTVFVMWKRLADVGIWPLSTTDNGAGSSAFRFGSIPCLRKITGTSLWPCRTSGMAAHQ